MYLQDNTKHCVCSYWDLQMTIRFWWRKSTALLM